MRTSVLVIAATLGLFGILWWHDVPTEPTSDDRKAIAVMLAGQDVAEMPARYDDQVRTIAAVQAAVLRASPAYRSIPKGQTREPADLLEARRGMCYDRSRSIEKALAALGYEVRHVSVYPSLTDLLLPVRAPSHALSEVRTERGWMLVDSVTLWLGLDTDGDPVSADQLGTASLRNPIPGEIDIMAGDFVHVVGLYSRHGQFYPPFTPIPDVSWRQLAANLKF